MTEIAGRGSHHVSEPLRQQVQGRLAVGGDEGVDVHDQSDAVCDAIRGAGHGHAPIAGSAQNHLVEILELEHRDDILHVRGESHVGSQVDALAHARQGRGEHDVTLHPQRQRHRCPFPAAAKAAVNDHERRHCDKPLIRPVHRRHAAAFGSTVDRQRDGYFRVRPSPHQVPSPAASCKQIHPSAVS